MTSEIVKQVLGNLLQADSLEVDYELAAIALSDVGSVNFIAKTKGFSIGYEDLLLQCESEGLIPGDVSWKQSTNSFLVSYHRRKLENSDQMFDHAQIILVEHKGLKDSVTPALSVLIISEIFELLKTQLIKLDQNSGSYHERHYDCFQIELPRASIEFPMAQLEKMAQKLSAVIVNQCDNDTNLAKSVAAFKQYQQANLFSVSGDFFNFLSLVLCLLEDRVSEIQLVRLYSDAKQSLVAHRRSSLGVGEMRIISGYDSQEYLKNFPLPDVDEQLIANVDETLMMFSKGTLLNLEESKRELDFMLWGDTSSGKTVYLAQLYLNLGATFNSEKTLLVPHAPSSDAKEYFKARQKEMLHDNELPAQTMTGNDTGLAFMLEDREKNESWLLNIRDRAGEDLVREHADVAQAFGASDGVIIFLNSIDQDGLFAKVRDIVSEIYFQSTKSNVRKIPVAVCVTKFDAHISNRQELELARTQHAAVVERVIEDGQLLTYINEQFENVAYFPISSIGMKVNGDVASNVIFFDNQFNNRIVIDDDVQKLNLLEPLKWLISQSVEHGVFE